MVWSIGQVASGGVWALAAKQHGVVSREQLLELGLSRRGIEHRLRKGRLYPVRHRGRILRGVFVVGRPELGLLGVLMAGVLIAGPEGVLSHESAGMLWGIRPERVSAPIEVTVPASGRHPSGLRVHRRTPLPEEDRSSHREIPVTSPARTLIDLANRLTLSELEVAVNEADKLDRVDPETLRQTIGARPRLQGIGPIRSLLDRRTFVLTDSELERRFLPLARRAGLPRPQAGARVNGFKVDFFWPELRLVVETDGLRYHRTPAAQARDRERDHAHAAAGLMPLRFTHAQVAFEARHVVATLVAVRRRLTT